MSQQPDSSCVYASQFQGPAAISQAGSGRMGASGGHARAPRDFGIGLPGQGPAQRGHVPPPPPPPPPQQ